MDPARSQRPRDGHPPQVELELGARKFAETSAPPKTIVTSLGIGMQADSSTMRTKIAQYP
jgi:hypothetical protein